MLDKVARQTEVPNCREALICSADYGTTASDKIITSRR